MRNAVKATVDAYDGSVNLYVFDDADPIIGHGGSFSQAVSAGLGDARRFCGRTTRYPETLFRVQAEIYRTFHMLDPQSFYNKEDVWTWRGTWPVARMDSRSRSPDLRHGDSARLRHAGIPVLTSFTPPRPRDNLIGMMLARCDGEHLGEIVVAAALQTRADFGPMQIAARINQDQTISKDLTLWNRRAQQSSVARLWLLPVDNTFLYVEPIYIQANEAKMRS